MKLVYVPIKNFGDELNPWIWRQLLGSYLDIDEDSCSFGIIDSDISLLSIGSYLDGNFLASFTPGKKAVIAGTGCGYGMVSTPYNWGVSFPYRSRLLFKLPVAFSQQRFTSSKRFYWVRGPLTSHVLGLPRETAVADGAYLIRKVLPLDNFPERHLTVFMPHTSSAQLAPWQDLCDQIGFTYIDPRESRTDVIQTINQAKVLITDALHGAIVSDALRVPWIPVRTSQCILEFKWRDHCSSIGLDYKPIDISVSWSPSQVMATQRSFPKKVLFGARTKLSNWLVKEEQVAKDLLYAAHSQSYLSSDSMISNIDERLETLVNQIKDDIQNHPFFNKVPMPLIEHCAP